MSGVKEWYYRIQGDVDKVTDGNGWKVMTQLWLTYLLFSKAMASNLVNDTRVPYYQNLNKIDAGVMNNFITVARSPWGIKTLWGAASDAFPIMGFHKKNYILFAVFASVSALGGLILYPATEGQAAAVVATIFFFLFSYGEATVDSLTQARYTEIMKASGNVSIVSFVWFLIMGSQGFTMFASLLFRLGNFKILLYPAMFLAVPMLWPALNNYICEEQKEPKCCNPDVSKLKEHPGVFALSLMLGIGTLLGNAINLIAPGNFFVIVSYYVTLCVVACVLSFFVLPMNIAKPSFYMILCTVLRLYAPTQIQLWYTTKNQYGMPRLAKDCVVRFEDHLPADKSIWLPSGDCDKLPECQEFIDKVAEHHEACKTEGDCCETMKTCFPTAPGFDVSYYQTAGNVIGFFMSMLALTIFENFMTKWAVRKAFWMTTVWYLGAGVLQMIMYERWNHQLFGSNPGDPDTPWADLLFYVVGGMALENLLYMLDFLPSCVLIGKLCPKNMEATIFAVQAAMQNFGTNVAAYISTYVLAEVLGFKASAAGGDACSNPRITYGGITLHALSWALLTVGMIASSFTVLLTWVLLPPGNLDDDLLGEVSDPREIELQPPQIADDPAYEYIRRSSLLSGGRSNALI